MHALAQHLQAQGRGNDSMLVHMTPGEVSGLQSLAKSAGGSLTINPTTGFPEAGWLESLLPTLAGVAGGALGVDPYIAGLGGAAVQTAITGDLGKGLMAGLGAFGGASIGYGMLGGSGRDTLGLNSSLKTEQALGPTAPGDIYPTAIPPVLTLSTRVCLRTFPPRLRQVARLGIAKHLLNTPLTPPPLVLQRLC